MEKATIIEMKELEQKFCINKHLTINAVDKISFSIKKGEIFALVGESGCGKSTIAKTIMGVNTLTGGQIFF